MEFPKILVVFIALIGELNIEELVDGISQIVSLLTVTGVVGAFSLSGVPGSNIIGVGLSETWGVISMTFLLVVVAGTVLKTDVVLTTPKVDDTVELPGSLFTTGSEKLKDAVTVVVAAAVEVKIYLVSGAEVFEMFFDAVKLNVVSGFELKLKVVNITGSFAGTISCLFFNLSSVLNSENTIGVSKDLLIFKGSKLKLFLSFDSLVSEITSRVDFVETTLSVLLKFMGVVVDNFKLQFIGSLLKALVEIVLFSDNVVRAAVLKTTVSLPKTL